VQVRHTNTHSCDIVFNNVPLLHLQPESYILPTPSSLHSSTLFKTYILRYNTQIQFENNAIIPVKIEVKIINVHFYTLVLINKKKTMICVTSQFQQLKTNKNREFHHSSKTDNPVYPIY